MKKIMIILGVIVLGWLGTTAYISNSFKGEFDQYIQTVNKLYASQGVYYKADVNSSFFTSDVKLEIHFDEKRLGKAITDVYANFIELPVKVEYKVEHGPIFYRDGFGIGFAKFNAEMKASEMLAGKFKENLVEAIPEDITLYLTEVLCFDKKLKMKMHSNAITLTENGEKVEIEPLVGSGLIDTKTLLGSFDITFPKMSVEGNGITAGITGTTLHVEMKDILGGKYLLGEGQFKIAKVTMEQDGLSKPVEMDFTMNFNTGREEGDYLMIAFDMQFNQEGLDQLDPTVNEIAKQANFAMKLHGLSPEALKKLEEVNQKQVEMTDTLYAMMMETDPSKAEAAQKRAEVAQETYMNTLTEAFRAMLVKDRTKMSASLDFTTKDDAKSSMSFSIGYVGEALTGSLEEMTAYLQTKPLEYLALDADLNFNEKHFALNPSPQEQQQAKMGLDMAVMQGFMSLENGIYSTKLEYKPKVLKINGQDKTQEILPMLEMSMAQGTMN
ncbi:DUF945 family protein [Sulfurovum sp. zt1-1]|uniref:DUF945 family protein n=1 Tax=Sulfurovum zhangzhouensis TaxID=3019067 RepID=A0ABT7R0H8_9BACT|nr:DUF945 family protein [Sulfurovum zhangzhouensis]MDM5272599.1 DUF945 family protein [Sulfurovum zhangzhouensis]